MPNSDFFVRFGLFIEKNFLDFELCREIRAQMLSAEQEPAMVVDRATSMDTLKETVRKTAVATLPTQTESFVMSRCQAMKEIFGKHFNTQLADCEDPQFLLYRKGDFFTAHRDRSDEPHKPEFLKRRRVTVTLFLNNQSEESGPDSYTGGSLVLYGLIDDPQWKKRGFPLAGQEGLLVAFPSDLFHEVEKVTSGERYTITTWFYD